MKILQELPVKCECALCDAGCLCGDCDACSRPGPTGRAYRAAKSLSIAACLLLLSAGFVFFAPVVALGATPTVTETFSLKFQGSGNSTQPLGSIGFCYLGDGAVLINGTYYPSVSMNQSARQICQHK